MSRQYFGEAFGWQDADGTAVANTVTETIIFSNVVIPANYMAYGRALELTARGRYSSTGTPTIRYRLRWGGVSGTVLWDTGTITVGSGVTNALWSIPSIILQTRANGAAGSLFAMGEVIVGSGLAPTVGSATGSPAEAIGGSAGVLTPAAVTVDLTADTALSITAQWSAASASNTLTGHQYLIRSWN